jgi:hypothetical protein
MNIPVKQFFNNKKIWDVKFRNKFRASWKKGYDDEDEDSDDWQDDCYCYYVKKLRFRSKKATTIKMLF